MRTLASVPDHLIHWEVKLLKDVRTTGEEMNNAVCPSETTSESATTSLDIKQVGFGNRATRDVRMGNLIAASFARR